MSVKKRKEMSPHQRDVLARIVTVFDGDEFKITTWPNLFITDGRGRSVDTSGVKAVTIHALQDVGAIVGKGKFYERRYVVDGKYRGEGE